MTLGDWHCDRVFFFMLTITTKTTEPKKKKTYLPWGGEELKTLERDRVRGLGFLTAD